MSKVKKETLRGKNPVSKRNPVALNPLMKKSHAHTESTKAERSKNKRKLNKALRDGSAEDQ